MNSRWNGTWMTNCTAPSAWGNGACSWLTLLYLSVISCILAAVSGLSRYQIKCVIPHVQLQAWVTFLDVEVFSGTRHGTFRSPNYLKVGCNISVGITTDYGLDGPGIEHRWGARFSAPVQTDRGTYPACCTVGTGSFSGVKTAGDWRYLSPTPV
jgi:hypothetical protein